MPKCYKIVFLGSKKVGKTAIIEQLVHGHHNIGSVSETTQHILLYFGINAFFMQLNAYVRYVNNVQYKGTMSTSVYRIKYSGMVRAAERGVWGNFVKHHLAPLQS
jgi:GTPase SAR1 family protein